jgi:hypothetical protein
MPAPKDPAKKEIWLEKIRKNARTPNNSWFVKGHKHSEETKIKISKSKKGKASGKNHWNWKERNYGYRAVHYWVESHKGKAKICSICGKTEGRINWANVDHKYKRKLKDYLSMCVSCHQKYDKKLRARKELS